MVARIHIKRDHAFLWAVLLSALLHLLLMFLYGRWGVLQVILPRLSHMPKPEEKRIAFEIVETPEESRTSTPPENATLLSDKNALARDSGPESLPEGLPYSQGQGEVKEIPRPAVQDAQAGNAGLSGTEASGSQAGETSDPGFSGESDPSGTRYSYIPSVSEAGARFSREVLLGQNPVPRETPRSAYEQLETGAKDVGGISFNTYEWEFAPYLLELKERIQRNLFPPPAFTQLGFEGINVIRFRIYPDGRMEGLEVLDFQGEKALVETSRKAILVSSPFNPLPRNFPERYLEVTGKFVYYIMK